MHHINVRIQQAVLMLMLLTFPVFANADSTTPRDLRPPANDNQARLDAFTKEAGITRWPRHVPCDYDESFRGKVVGLVLNVRSPTAAYGYWSSRCHGLTHHDIVDWPQSLPAGTYVVAVTSDSDAPKSDSAHNRVLQIVAVLGQRPATNELLAMVRARMCAQPRLDDARVEDPNCSGAIAEHSSP